MPRWLRYSTLIAISFASIAMLGLAISLFNPKLFDRYFLFLLVLNAVIAAVLFCVVTTLCLRLARRQRSKQYGSHMTAKLALTTALISVVPTLTVYAISTAFISRSLQDSLLPARGGLARRRRSHHAGDARQAGTVRAGAGT